MVSHAQAIKYLHLLAAAAMGRNHPPVQARLWQVTSARSIEIHQARLTIHESVLPVSIAIGTISHVYLPAYQSMTGPYGHAFHSIPLRQ